MRRRGFIAALAGAALWPAAGQAQQPKRVPRIGILLFSDADRAVIRPLLEALDSLGYVDGKTAVIEYRDAEGRLDRLEALARELARLAPDVIFSFGGEQAPSVKRAITSIPVVVVVSNDPVASGLVASLARPGGNITGVTYVHDGLAGKVIELLKDAAPRVSRVAIVWNPAHTDPVFRETQRGARALGVALQSLEVRASEDIDAALQAAARERAEALIVVGSRLVQRGRHRIGEFAAKHRLPLVGNPRWLLEAGAVLTYGPNTLELHRRAATYVDKILRGARPADLPMQQPATFELVINLKQAKAVGLALPATLLARADEVIE